MAFPQASRPRITGYDLEPSDDGLLPWSWAEERLTPTKTYMLGTVTPDGTPHVAPIWGLWIDNALVFSTGENTRKARNLAANGRCTVSIERDDEAVTIEAVARVLEDASLKARVLIAYQAKYAWDMSTDASPWFVARPLKAFGFIDKDGLFGKTATRWLFEA